MKQTCEPKSKKNIANALEAVIFGSRWTLAPMYLGLIVAELLYLYKFMLELYEMCAHLKELSEEQMLIGLLGLVDFTMVANLVVMIMVGGYSIFVRRMTICAESRPQWLDHVDSTTLKIKMGLSLVGVSSIYLLKRFINVDTLHWDQLWMLLAIHIVFVVSTLSMAWIYRLIQDTGVYAGKGHDAHPPATPPAPQPAASHADHPADSTHHVPESATH